MPERNTSKHSQNKRIYEGMKHLILCEGMDAWNFLIQYLNSNALKQYPELSSILQVEDFGGIDELPKKMKLWTMAPGFENIKSLTVIRDAEKDVDRAINDVKYAFKESQLPVPKEPSCLVKGDSIVTGFFLFPSCDNQPVPGTLEDLCLDIICEKEKDILSEIDSFLNKLEDNDYREFPHRFKTKLHTYFSITDRYVSLKIGEAAKAGAFDWESEKLTNLKKLLCILISDI